jgi:CheY-like chemotaxis protein
MPQDSKSSRSGEETESGAPLLDTVARRIEALSLSVAEQTARLLARRGTAEHTSAEELNAIVETARRSSELARELVVLARSQRDAADAALRERTSRRSSERPLESEPVVSHRRMRQAQSKVLLVEDEPLLLKTMRRMLEQYGHQVLAASTSVEALAVALQESHIDLVVTDLVLPGMSGSELVQRLRARRPEVRVLYTSGWDPASSGVTLAGDGSEAFLSKPFTAAELEACLLGLLGSAVLDIAERG